MAERAGLTARHLLPDARALHGGLPYVAGITLGVFVYAIDGLSGCHINPAVTVGLLAARRLPIAAGVVHIVARVIGALIARLVAPLIREMPEEFAAAGGWAEFFGFGFLIVTVLAVSDGYAPKGEAASPSAAR